MKQPKLTGTQVPQFTYDTPQQAENDFYALCAGETPLVLVFLPNFGHPLSRTYLNAYRESLPSLAAGRLACVVRSAPSVIAAQAAADGFGFPLICDAEGVLYDYFGVRETTSFLDWTFAARRIMRAAKKEGYRPEQGTPQLLPLTLVLGEEGKILYAHRARSLTDLPEDCEAIEAVCRQLARRRAAAQQSLEPDAAQSVQGQPQAEEQSADWFEAELLAQDTPPQTPAAADAAAVPDVAAPEAFVASAVPDAIADTPDVAAPQATTAAPDATAQAKLDALLADLAMEQQRKTEQ